RSRKGSSRSHEDGSGALPRWDEGESGASVIAVIAEIEAPVHGDFSSNTTTMAASPSLRPMKPKPLVLVPRTLTASAATRRSQAKEAGDAGADLADMRRDPRGLGDDDRVDVRNRESALLGQLARTFHEECAVGLAPSRIGIRKLLADRSFPGGAEQRIGQRVEQGITVGVAAQTQRVSQSDAAQPQDARRSERMSIEAQADTEMTHGFILFRNT